MEGQSYTFLSNQFFTFNIMISSSVLIHLPDTIAVKDHLNDLGITYRVNNNVEDELDVIVDDVPYEFMNGTYQDPDVQLCEFYGINYDLVNCIELA